MNDHKTIRLLTHAANAVAVSIDDIATALRRVSDQKRTQTPPPSPDRPCAESSQVMSNNPTAQAFESANTAYRWLMRIDDDTLLSPEEQDEVYQLARQIDDQRRAAAEAMREQCATVVGYTAGIELANAVRQVPLDSKGWE